MRCNSIFESDETDAALLIDASNAFNSRNRAAALHNVRALCPIIATYAINTYRAPARLIVIGGEELLSSEGTTQGDPTTMSLYAISLQPLITGPALGYYPNAKKCWLVVKPENLKEANDVFARTGIHITMEGRKHLGAALGQRSYLEEYVGSKVKEWISEVTLLAEFATSQLQASYAAFTLGLRHKWNYFMRTLPDI